jgi:ribosomal protein L29
MKIKEMQKLDNKDLLSHKEELEQELLTIRAQIATKTTLENPGRKRSIKKTISRINTLTSQKNRIKQGETNETKTPSKK